MESKIIDWKTDFYRAIFTNKPIPDSVPVLGITGFYIGKVTGLVSTFIGTTFNKIPYIRDIKGGFDVGFTNACVEDPVEKMRTTTKEAFNQGLDTMAKFMKDYQEAAAI